MLTATIQGRDAPWYEGIGFGVIDVERFLAHVGGRPMTIARARRGAASCYGHVRKRAN